MKTMSVDQAVAALNEIGEDADPLHGDLEYQHILMDEILKCVVTKRVRDAYEATEEKIAGYVGGMWYA